MTIGASIYPNATSVSSMYPTRHLARFMVVQHATQFVHHQSLSLVTNMLHPWMGNLSHHTYTPTRDVATHDRRMACVHPQRWPSWCVHRFGKMGRTAKHPILPHITKRHMPNVTQTPGCPTHSGEMGKGYASPLHGDRHQQKPQKV